LARKIYFANAIDKPYYNFFEVLSKIIGIMNIIEIQNPKVGIILNN